MDTIYLDYYKKAFSHYFMGFIMNNIVNVCVCAFFLIGVTILLSLTVFLNMVAGKIN